MIECKNAKKNEEIALRVDQIRRDLRETRERFVSQQPFTQQTGLRELRKAETFAEEDDLDEVTATAESLFHLLEKAFGKG